MHPLRRLSVIEQCAAHLREGLRRGHWQGIMPGVRPLATDLSVSRNTIEAALRILETEGLLSPQGAGRRRAITGTATTATPRRVLRVGILLHDSSANRQDRYINELQYALDAAGHPSFIAEQSQLELKYDVRRIVRHVSQTPADAWIVSAGTREVLEWFSTQPFPSIAMFGRRSGLPIAAVGPDKVPAYVEATRHLIRFGHRRIVLLCRKLRRFPQPGNIERAFLAELAAHGIPLGEFNLPDWEETPAGFNTLLTSLFKTTPPTALIIDEATLFVAVQQFLLRHRIQVPGEVSLVTSDNDPSFALCDPAIAHIRWNSKSLVGRIVRWANTVSQGGTDLKQTRLPAQFIPGGTIAPASKGCTARPPARVPAKPHPDRTANH